MLSMVRISSQVKFAVLFLASVFILQRTNSYMRQEPLHLDRARYHLFATRTGWAHVDFLLESVRLGIVTGTGWAHVDFLLESVRLGIATGSGVGSIRLIVDMIDFSYYSFLLNLDLSLINLHYFARSPTRGEQPQPFLPGNPLSLPPGPPEEEGPEKTTSATGGCGHIEGQGFQSRNHQSRGRNC